MDVLPPPSPLNTCPAELVPLPVAVADMVLVEFTRVGF